MSELNYPKAIQPSAPGSSRTIFDGPGQHIACDPAKIKLCECGCGQATKPARANNTGKGYVKGQGVRFIANHAHRANHGIRVIPPEEMAAVPDGFRSALDRHGKSYAHYFVASDGQVGSIKKIRNYDKEPSPFHILKGAVGTNGYRGVGLVWKTNPWAVRTEEIHKLVARAWIGIPSFPDPQVNHKDGDKLNNDYLNLEWTTRKGNGEHASRTGLIARGERVIHAKLTEQNVRDIRAMYKAGCLQRVIAEKFSVIQANVSMIIVGKTWKHVV